jgi:uncharacterized phage protein gp47/JayE
MQLQLRTFDAIVSSAAAAVQGAAQQVLDLTVGSVLRAVLEANAGLGLWVQWLILQVLQTTRAATSSGPDLDSWVADFQLTRLPASAATGQVTFARFSPVAAALVPVGTLVRTADGSQTFAVTADSTNPAWSAAQNGYLIPAGTQSVTVPIAANVAGSAGNVQAGTISLIAAALPGVDTVSNAAPTAGGLDAESDPALRARFAAFLDSRSRATPVAVGYAISTVQQGLQYAIQENVTQSGTPQAGCFVVTVDNGTGAPPANLLAAVSQQIESVRPLGSIWTVVPPGVVGANVSMTITTAPGANHANTVATVTAAITNFIDTLTIGQSLPWSRLAQVAYDASSQVTNVSAVLLNGATADLSPGPGGVVKAGSVVVS